MHTNKKNERPFQVEDFKLWLNELLEDPYADVHDPNGVRLDVFEAEHTYIIEGDIPAHCEGKIRIEKTAEGLRITIANKTNHASQHDVKLPAAIANKPMQACVENDFLSIRISKQEAVCEIDQTILL